MTVDNLVARTRRLDRLVRVLMNVGAPRAEGTRGRIYEGRTAFQESRGGSVPGTQA
jgi:hypothetical protein